MLICNSEDFVYGDSEMGPWDAFLQGNWGHFQGQANQVHLINDDSLDIAMNLPIPCVVLLWQKSFSHIFCNINKKTNVSHQCKKKKKKTKKDVLGA
jgi:hypothetical protein